MHWEIDYSISPPSCLPEGLDRSDLVDITRIGDTWRRYLNTQTNQIHDGADYFKELQEELK